MGKEAKADEMKRLVREDALSFPAPAGDKYVYVKDKDLFEVGSSEFDMISEFIRFVRGRERGTFTANIVSHCNKRYVLLDFTDRKRIDLEAIPEEG